MGSVRALRYAMGLAVLASFAMGCGAVVGESRKAGDLHKAAETGNTEAAQQLIQSGSDVNAPDDQGRTPLHYAAEADKADMVRLLAGNGANPGVKDQTGATPLDLADKNGSQAAYRALQEYATP